VFCPHRFLRDTHSAFPAPWVSSVQRRRPGGKIRGAHQLYADFLASLDVCACSQSPSPQHLISAPTPKPNTILTELRRIEFLTQVYVTERATPNLTAQLVPPGNSYVQSHGRLRPLDYGKPLLLGLTHSDEWMGTPGTSQRAGHLMCSSFNISETHKSHQHTAMIFQGLCRSFLLLNHPFELETLMLGVGFRATGENDLKPHFQTFRALLSIVESTH
jgi:hypothetical protein